MGHRQMTERVTCEINDHVALVTLDRAAKMNAFDPDMFAAVTECGRSLATRTDVRAVVLTGAGGNFSAGLDLGSMGGELNAESFVAGPDSPANRFQEPAWVWHALPVPVIAAIEGVCFGAGVQVASAADLRIASPEARLSIMETKWGLVPDMAMTAVLRDTVRQDWLKRLTYTAEIVSAEEALSAGLLSELHAQPVSRALEIAGEIASRSPDAVRAAKHLLDTALSLPRGDALALEAGTQVALMRGANQREAVMANIERRAPSFNDPEFDPTVLPDRDRQ